MTINDIPAEVKAAFKKHFDFEASLPKIRTAAQHGHVTRKFNKFIDACKAAGIDYVKATFILSSANDKMIFQTNETAN